MDRKQVVLGVILLCAIVFGAGYKTAQVRSRNMEKPGVAVNTESVLEKAKPRTVTVHVTGAVKKPGVYTLPEGARIIDGIKKAEAAKDAELNYVNLAEIMKDQQQVVLPKKGEISMTEAGGTGPGPAIRRAGAQYGVQAGKININAANTGELDKLPGIGPALAKRIVDYRKLHGSFGNISELQQVSGIGEKKFGEIKDRITI
ncbi:MAG: helix-hairpin-helix domain-containing protein [Eubacteriales bacterium]